MTIAHHPAEETLVDYVAGALDEGNSLVMAAHIARCGECQETVRLVPLPGHVKNIVLDLVRAARPKDGSTAAWVRELIEWGPGPRACQQLVLAAKARALLQGRHHVTRDDVETLAFPVLRHRIVPTFNAEAEGVSVDDLIRRLLQELPAASKQLL